MKAYYARPKKAGKFGAVVVIHENRGLNPHIKDVTRRVAKAGYLALASDALSPFDGTLQNEDSARELFGKLDTQKNLNNFLKAFDYLKSKPESNGKTGCVGFCWGGGLQTSLLLMHLCWMLLYHFMEGSLKQRMFRKSKQRFNYIMEV